VNLSGESAREASPADLEGTQVVEPSLKIPNRPEGKVCVYLYFERFHCQLLLDADFGKRLWRGSMLLFVGKRGRQQ
jgi:hypothetical protein